jgi:hypothetical protein
MKAYISGIGCISPVENFSAEMALPEKLMMNNEHPFIQCKEPVYKDYINPALLRRMSRVMKMGIASAMLCLKDAGVEVPEAVITATGLGCVEDSDKFLASLIENDEKMLNPTPFIQSTHNTIGSQIALQLKCHGYNTTYAGRGACFEMALLDSLMLLKEEEVKNVLAGAYDELTPNLITIFHRLGLFRKIQYENKISYSGIAGEGASFGLLSATPGPNDYAVLKGVSLFPFDKEPRAHVQQFLSEQELKLNDIQMVLFGFNDLNNYNKEYEMLIRLFDQETALTQFKNMCGEYATSSSFSFWLAAQCLKNQVIPEPVIFRKGSRKEFKNILILNHTLGNQFSAILLTRC